eukprot:CAMPEP_0172681548 /NCGR_PEP_ID=MMETSP1074-20121228/17533_1 /TAXON_ID=2916 /ORGANISM="Ceratium fusus, Strain PA161109" /LENGTH=386 /DNA_ID=CAMNT_0013500069 /DNA_START=245 /DNA_END=1405 /DNA_ORIENTATION=-
MSGVMGDIGLVAEAEKGPPKLPKANSEHVVFKPSKRHVQISSQQRAKSNPNRQITPLDRRRSTSLGSSTSSTPFCSVTGTVIPVVLSPQRASSASTRKHALGQQTKMATPLRCTRSFLVCPRATSCPSVLVAPLSLAKPPGHSCWGSSYTMMPKLSPGSEEYSVECSTRASSDTDDNALCRATAVIKRMNPYLACACTAVVVVTVFALLCTANKFSTALSAGGSPLSSAATDAAAAALMGGAPAGSMAAVANSTSACRARRLTEKYIKLRFENDADALERLFADDIELHVDLSRAGMLVAMKIKSLLGFHTELVGRENVARYYRALPTESGDPMPKANSFRCFDNACIVTCTVQRPLVGSVTDVGTLHWRSKQDRLRKVDLSFWSR